MSASRWFLRNSFLSGLAICNHCFWPYFALTVCLSVSTMDFLFLKLASLRLPNELPRSVAIHLTSCSAEMPSWLMSLKASYSSENLFPFRKSPAVSLNPSSPVRTSSSFLSQTVSAISCFFASSIDFFESFWLAVAPNTSIRRVSSLG